ncbi:MAG: hypothetical protein U9Q07_14135, partial [Planctomycetota bacterium]|nr:hypothetical protein [Planctomycetota bacterium]
MIKLQITKSSHVFAAKSVKTQANSAATGALFVIVPSLISLCPRPLNTNPHSLFFYARLAMKLSELRITKNG